MAEEKRPPIEDEEDPFAGEISMTPMQTTASAESSSVGAATPHTNTGGRVGTFIELQPKFKALQQELRDYVNASTPTATTVSPSASTTSYTPQTQTTAAPQLTRGIYTKGQKACDVFCYITTVVLYLLAMFAYGYDAYTGRTFLLPQFFLEESVTYVSPLIAAFQQLGSATELYDYLEIARLGFLGINAIVLLVKMHIYAIKCFIALCHKQSVQVRMEAIKLYRVLVFHSLAFALLGDAGYTLAPVLKTFIMLAGAAYLIVCIGNAPKKEDSLPEERFGWKKRLIGAISGFLLVEILNDVMGTFYYAFTQDVMWMGQGGDAYLLTLMLIFDLFFFVVGCIFAKRADRIIAPSLTEMIIRRQVYIDYTNSAVNANDKYLSFKRLLTLAVVAFAICFMIYPSILGALYSPEQFAVAIGNQFLSAWLLAFFEIVLLAIGTQIARNVGKRR